MGPPPSLLIAEDDAGIRKVLAQQFSRLPYDVRLAENGAAAAMLIRERTPDVLLCDLDMPVRDGWWILERFPKAERAFRVIVLSDRADPEAKTRCGQLGVDAFCVKSETSLSTILQRVREVLRSARR